MFTLRRIDNGEQRVYKERVGLCAPARKFGSRYTIPAMAESRVAIDDWRLAIGNCRQQANLEFVVRGVVRG